MVSPHKNLGSLNQTYGNGAYLYAPNNGGDGRLQKNLDGSIQVVPKEFWVVVGEMGRYALDNSFKVFSRGLSILDRTTHMIASKSAFPAVYAAETCEQSWELSLRSGKNKYGQRLYEEAIGFFNKALHCVDHKMAKEVAKILKDRAIAHHATGKLAEAIEDLLVAEKLESGLMEQDVAGVVNASAELSLDQFIIKEIERRSALQNSKRFESGNSAKFYLEWIFKQAFSEMNVLELGDSFRSQLANYAEHLQAALPEDQRNGVTDHFLSFCKSINYQGLKEPQQQFNAGYLTFSGISSIDAMALASILPLLSHANDITMISFLETNGGGTLGDDGIAAIARVLPKSVKNITAYGQKIGEKGVRALGEALHEGIIQINLTGNPIGPAGAHALSQNLPTTLIILELRNTELSDFGVQDIVQNLPSSIQKLDIGQNGIGVNGAEELISMFQGGKLGDLDKNGVIKSLIPTNWERGGIALKGEQCTLVLERLLPFATFKDVDLPKLELTYSQIDRLVGKLPKQLERLNLSGNKWKSVGLEKDIAHFKKYPQSLKALDLTENCIHGDHWRNLFKTHDILKGVDVRLSDRPTCPN